MKKCCNHKTKFDACTNESLNNRKIKVNNFTHTLLPFLQRNISNCHVTPTQGWMIK